MYNYLNPMNYDSLITTLISRGILKKPQTIEAFKKIKRADFVKPEYFEKAHEDRPFPLTAGQTISQPTTVAFMIEKLELQPGDKVLDLGSGSGWTTALIAEIVGVNGKVFGVEIIPELVEFGTKNINKYQIRHGSINKATNTLGLLENAPYDKILVSAAAKNNIPQELLTQLKNGGTIVIPVDSKVVVAKKDENGKISQEEFTGFSFVPLLEPGEKKKIVL